MSNFIKVHDLFEETMHKHNVHNKKIIPYFDVFFALWEKFKSSNRFMIGEIVNQSILFELSQTMDLRVLNIKLLFYWC